MMPGDQLNMVVCFWYLVKHDLSSVRTGITFTRYQNNMAMFIWSVNTTLGTLVPKISWTFQDN